MNLLKMHPFLSAVSIVLALFSTSAVSAQAPVKTNEEIAGFIHIDRAGRQATRAKQILNSIGGDIEDGDLKAILTRRLGDPSQVLMPVDGSVTIVWMDAGNDQLVQIIIMSQYSLTSYMTECLKSVGLVGESVDDETVIILPETAHRDMRDKRKILVDLHTALHPADFSMTLKEPLLRELSDYIASRLKRMERYRVNDVIEGFKPLLPPLALEPLGREADKLQEATIVDRKLTAHEEQLLDAMNAVLSQSQALHFDFGLFTETFQPRLTLELKPDSPMHALSGKALLPPPALVRYLPDDTALRFSLSYALGDLNPVLRPVLEAFAEKASTSVNVPSVSNVLENLKELDGARGPLVGALNPFIVAGNDETVLLGTNYSDTSIEHLGRILLGRNKKGIAFKPDAEKLERHPVDHFIEGQSDTPALFVLRPAEYVVFARPKRSLLDTSDRLLRVKPLADPLLSQQKMLPGMLLYVDYRPVGSIKQAWQESPYALLAVRMDEGYMQFLVHCPASSFVPVVADLSFHN